MPHPLIKNLHLDRDPFFLKGGPVGIVLVHSFKATPAEMRPLGKFIHSNGYTVSGPILPGNNTYPEDINNFTCKDWVASVENAYWSLVKHCDQVFIGGESTGVLLAIYLATYPPEIAGILTYAPALNLFIQKGDIIKLYLLAPFVPYIKENDSYDNLLWRGYQAIHRKGIIQGCLDTRIPHEVPGTIYKRVSSVLKEIHWIEKSSHCVVLDVELETVKALAFQFIKKALG